MLRLCGGLVFGLLACAGFAGHAGAQAQPQPQPQAQVQSQAEAAESPEYRAAIDEAVQAFSNQDWPAARVAFGRAHTLSPSARTCRGVGLSLFYLRDYVGARIAFEQALAETRKPLSLEQHDELERFLGSAKLETGRYELRVTPVAAHLQLTIDAMPRTPGVVILARGSHELVANADGFNEHRASVVVNGGEDTTLELSLTAIAPIAPLPVSPTLTPSTPHDAADSSWPAPDTAVAPDPGRSWTWVAFAAAAPVLVGVGTGVWLTGKHKHDELAKRCHASDCSQARLNSLTSSRHIAAYQAWSTVTFVAAGASLVTSIVLFVIGGSDQAIDSAKQAGPPMLSVGPAGATFTAQF